MDPPALIRIFVITVELLFRITHVRRPRRFAAISTPTPISTSAEPHVSMSVRR